MTPNRYAPPTAQVADVAPQEEAPALWNPNAAANWCLLFSPAFGALVHMKNWQALGRHDKAAASRVWAILSLVVIGGFSCLAALLPTAPGLDALARLGAFSLLVAWYFSSARAQAKYVKQRFGTSYPRKGWGKPILLAILVLAAFFVAVVLLAIVGVALTTRA